MTYSASIQWLAPGVGVVRVHPGPGMGFGDPYVWAATIEQAGPVGILWGTCKPLDRPMARALLDAMAFEGMARLERMKLRDDGAMHLTRPIRTRSRARRKDGAA